MPSRRYIPSRKAKEFILKDNITLVGAPIVRKDTLCMLSPTNYATIDSFRPDSYAWEQRYKVQTGFKSTQGMIAGGASAYSKPVLGVGPDGWVIYLSSDGSSWDIADGVVSNTELELKTDYYLKFGWDGTNYYLDVSEDGETYERVIEVESTTPIYDSTALNTLGCYDGVAWSGSIYLKDCSTTVWDTIHYYKETVVGGWVDWDQPVLSGYGVMGGDSFACSVDSVYSYLYGWKAFVNDTDDENFWHSEDYNDTHWIAWYNPEPLHITNINVMNRKSDSGSFPDVVVDYQVQTSIDGSNWTTIYSGTNSTRQPYVKWNIDLSSLSDEVTTSKYWRLLGTSFYARNYMCIGFLKLTAQTGGQQIIIEDGTPEDYTYYEYDPTVRWSGTEVTYRLYSNITKVGTPSITENAVSGFSSSSYLEAPLAKRDGVLYIHFKTGTLGSSYQDIIGATYWLILEWNGSKLASWKYDGGYTVTLGDIQSDTEYWMKIVVSGDTRGFYISTDGEEYTELNTFTDAGAGTQTNWPFRIGQQSYDSTTTYDRSFKGEMYLNDWVLMNSDETEVLWKPSIAADAKNLVNRYIPKRNYIDGYGFNISATSGVTVEDGHIVSGFTSSTSAHGIFYLKYPVPLNSISSFEVDGKFMLNGYTTSGRIFQVNATGNVKTGLYVQVDSSIGVSVRFYDGSSENYYTVLPADNLQLNTWYDIKILYEKPIIKCLYSTDGVNYVLAPTTNYRDYSVSGSVTVSGDYASNFATRRYLYSSKYMPSTFSKVVIETKFKFSSASAVMDILSIWNSEFFTNGWNLATSSSRKIRLWSYASGEVWGNTVMDLNRWYWVRVVCTSEGCTAYLSDDGETYTEECTQVDSEFSKWMSSATRIYMGVRYYSSGSRGEAFTSGTVNLKETKVYVDDALWWNPAYGKYEHVLHWANFTNTTYFLGGRNNADTELNGKIDLKGCKFKINGEDMCSFMVPYGLGISNVTKVGSPVMANDFSSCNLTDSNYYTTTLITRRDAILTTCFALGELPSSTQCILRNNNYLYIQVNSGDGLVTYSSNRSITQNILRNPKIGQKYWVKVKIEGNYQTFYYSTDGVNYITSCKVENTKSASATTYIGRGSSTGLAFASGCLYMDEWKYTDLEGNVIWEPYASYTTGGSIGYLPSRGEPVPPEEPEPEPTGGYVANLSFYTGGTISNDFIFNGNSQCYMNTGYSPSLQSANSWEFRTKYLDGNAGAYPHIVAHDSNTDCQLPTLAVLSESRKFRVFLSSNGSSWDIASDVRGSLSLVSGTYYYIKFGFNGSEYYVDYNTTGWDNSFTRDVTISSSSKSYSNGHITLMGLPNVISSCYSNGSMDLKETSFAIDGSVVWQGVIEQNV